MVAVVGALPVMFPVEMTTATVLDPRKLSRTLYAQGGISEYTTSKNDAGNTVIHGLKVFRSGTFRDSLGIQRTWEPDHMTQFVSNFHLLRDSGIFPNVPVRDKHESFLGTGGDPVGYMSDLTAQGGKDPEGNDCVFLVADFEFTEPEAYEKLKRGTFRARSAEVGVYETNGEAFYWPVFLGFAFVAMGAVEGLYSKYSKDSPEASQYSIITEGAVVPETPPANPPTGAPAFQFSVGGKMTTDYAAVQARLTSLETENMSLRQFRDDAESIGRENFVRSLATGDAPKLFASQVEPLVALAKGMTDEQYAAWQKVYDDMPGIPALAKHGLPDGATGTPGGGGGGGSVDAEKQAVLDNEEQIKRHKRAGATDEQIQGMSCYKKLQALYTRRPDLKSAV